MDIINILSGPVIGAVIGYITNDIAIRMLFRPHRAIYVLGHRLPFTPGIVPRRKDQLARILGEAIVAKFFNADDLEVVFTSGISDAVADRVVKLLQSDARLDSLADSLPDGAAEDMERELCVRIQAAICTSGIPAAMAEQGEKMLCSALGKTPGGKLLAAGIAGSCTDAIAHEIEEFVIEHGHEYILPLLKKELERFAGTPISEISAPLREGREEELRETVKALYLRFMQSHVRPIVESIDVGGMITEKIIQMSSEEVEDLVLTVVRRELRLVVLFGALVGGLIGMVNTII